MSGLKVVFSSTSSTGSVFVKMQYNDDEFYVHITGEEESLDGADNYQSNKIKEDFIKIIEDEEKIDIHDVKLYTPKFELQLLKFTAYP